MFMKCKVTVDTSHYPKEGPWELPEGWVWTTIGELCTVFSAKRVHQSDWQKVGIPFYRAREIVKLSEHGYVDNDLFISEKLYNEFIGTGLIPGPGDIMISAVGTIGKTYIVRATDRFYFKDASVLCLRNPYLIPAYLDLYLQSTLARTQMHDGSKGRTVDTITIEKASDYLIPIPPSAEQERIVSYLDSILPILVSIESQKACIENLIDKTKQRILDLAIHGKLVSQDPTDEPAIELIKRMNPAFQPSHNLHYEGTLPLGWSLCRLEDILEYEQPQAYIVKSTDYSEKYETPVLTPGKSFILGYTNESDGICNTLPVIIFDDFTTESKYVDFPFKVKSSAMKILRVKGEIDIRYVTFFMSITRLTGDTHKRYWISEYSKLCIPLPPLQEQKRIVAKIVELNEQLDRLSADIQRD